MDGNPGSFQGLASRIESSQIFVGKAWQSTIQECKIYHWLVNLPMFVDELMNSVFFMLKVLCLKMVENSQLPIRTQ
jgi:hypothetical protein